MTEDNFFVYKARQIKALETGRMVYGLIMALEGSSVMIVSYTSCY